MKRVCGDFVTMVAMLMVLMMASKEVYVMSGEDCNMLELMPCKPAVISSAQPTEACCSMVKSQIQCYCVYMKSPTFKHYVTPQVTKKISTACSVKIPEC